MTTTMTSSPPRSTTSTTSALTTTVVDAGTMLRRDLKHLQRYPSITVMLIGMPVVFLLLFVYVFGGTMGAGLGGSAGSGGRSDYLAYVLPGILVMAVAAVAQGTAISVAMDMTEGIIARFRTMAISRAAVMAGHVAGALIQTVLGVAVVALVALLIGYRPGASAGQWALAFAFLTMVGFALTWLTVAMGMAAKTVESASNTPMFLVLLPFLSSGFVPTDSMPAGVAWFAEHQPFTPFIDTVRGLLAGTPVGSSAAISAAWCAAIALASYLWSRTSYERLSER